MKSRSLGDSQKAFINGLKGEVRFVVFHLEEETDSTTILDFKSNVRIANSAKTGQDIKLAAVDEN